MSVIGNMKPRQFVREFQKRAGLLIDGVAGPQTRMALWLIPEIPPGRFYPPIPELPEHLRPKADTPTPIDPADIRPGDVVERRERVTVCQSTPNYVATEQGAWLEKLPGSVRPGVGVTWHLVHRPDPDAEAVQVIRSASYNIWFGEERLDPLPGLRESADLLNRLREQGWDVVRRSES